MFANVFGVPALGKDVDGHLLSSSPLHHSLCLHIRDPWELSFRSHYILKEGCEKLGAHSRLPPQNPGSSLGNREKCLCAL